VTRVVDKRIPRGTEWPRGIAHERVGNGSRRKISHGSTTRGASRTYPRDRLSLVSPPFPPRVFRLRPCKVGLTIEPRVSSIIVRDFCSLARALVSVNSTCRSPAEIYWRNKWRNNPRRIVYRESQRRIDERRYRSSDSLSDYQVRISRLINGILAKKDLHILR
jgi:hypothetical protein